MKSGEACTIPNAALKREWIPEEKQRMIRRLFNALSVLSLLLCIGLCMLWVRSYSKADLIGWGRLDPHSEFPILIADAHLKMKSPPAIDALLLGVGSGEIFWSRLRTYQSNDSPELHPGWIRFGGPAAPDAVPSAVRSHLGFGYEKQANLFAITWSYYTPCWFVCALLALIPAARLLTLRRKCGPGNCPKCGYDLRATPDRCPECGTKTKMPASIAGR